MRRFAELFMRLDQTTKTNEKVAALAEYFICAPDDDRLWTIALLSHRRPKRTVTSTQLREWGAELAGIPLWLFEESYPIVGDLAETIALILPEPVGGHNRSLSLCIGEIQSLKAKDDAVKKSRIFEMWSSMDYVERFLFNKLITGGFRFGVSQKLMTRALSKATGIDENVLAHRLMGDWTPVTTDFNSLVLTEVVGQDASKPYPFYLAYALEGEPADVLGDIADWSFEHKWDGIRGQLIHRGGEIFVWSRGEELVTGSFPEYRMLADFLPEGTVIDGEILPHDGEHPLPFQDLQTRISRKNVTKAVMAKTPVVLMAYDLLESDGKDLREMPFQARRDQLLALIEAMPDDGVLKLSPQVMVSDWAELAQVRANARAQFSEGLMIKRRSSPYQAGRKKGDWWKWKVDPLVIDGVMIYAQRGHGRRANLYSDFTFAVWRGQGDLVPFTKAYSGLTDQEFNEITAWVRKNTLDKFGPVRSVPPVHVFEIAFEGINKSTRHKSGVALRFPRIKRWRKDKPPEEANTLEDLHRLLQ